MAKKNILGRFEFKKLTQISNGLIIPTGNDTRPIMDESISLVVEPKHNTVHNEMRTKLSKRESHIFQKLEIDTNEFTPMTNVVPSIEQKGVQRGVQKGVQASMGVQKGVQKGEQKGVQQKGRSLVALKEIHNIKDIIAEMPTTDERKNYLKSIGIKIKVVRRGNSHYFYGRKRFDGERGLFYCGSVS